MTTFTQGQTVRPTDIRRLPLGTRINSRGTIFTVSHDGLWMGSHCYAPQYVANDVTIEHLGTEAPVLPLAMFKQRLRTLCVGQARQSSVSIGPVTTALDALGVRAPVDLRLGMFAHIYDREMTNILRPGVVGINGDPSSWDESAVYIFRDGGWNSLLGVRSSDATCLRLISLPPTITAGEWPEPEDDEEEKIAHLIRSVYSAGHAAKGVQGWCGDFEYAISRAGVDDVALSLTGPVHGIGGLSCSEPATHDLMNEAAIGTRISQGGSTWVKGVDGTWLSVTAANYDYIHVEGGSETVNFGVESLSITFRPVVVEVDRAVGSIDELLAAPVGTRVSNGGSLWEKCEPNLWRMPRNDGGFTGSATSSDFRIRPNLLWARQAARVFDGVLNEQVTWAQMSLAPTGSMISADGTLWQKNEAGRWQRPGARPAERTYLPHNIGMVRATWARLEPTEPHLEPTEQRTIAGWPGDAPAVEATPTLEQMNAAPIGAIVRTTPSVKWRKQAEGWFGNNNNLHTEAEHTLMGGMIWHDVVGFTVTIGDVVGTAMVERAPTGTLLRFTPSGNTYRKERWNDWVQTETGERIHNMNAMTEEGQVVLAGLP